MRIEASTEKPLCVKSSMFLARRWSRSLGSRKKAMTGWRKQLLIFSGSILGMWTNRDSWVRDALRIDLPSTRSSCCGDASLALVDLLLALQPLIRDAYPLLEDYLVPTPHFDRCIYRMKDGQPSFLATNPLISLSVLGRIVEITVRWSPAELREFLDAVVAADGTLAGDRDDVGLRDLCERWLYPNISFVQFLPALHVQAVVVPSVVLKRITCGCSAMHTHIDKVLVGLILILTGTKRYTPLHWAFLLSHGRSRKLKSCIAHTPIPARSRTPGRPIPGAPSSGCCAVGLTELMLSRRDRSGTSAAPPPGRRRRPDGASCHRSPILFRISADAC